MKWYCHNCGRKNDQNDVNCTKCGLDQEKALTMPVERRRRTCEDCGHMHHENIYCHVYTEAGDSLDDDPNVIDEEVSEMCTFIPFP
jgi:NMD protein affecting ribosome stability and mRNA decay